MTKIQSDRFIGLSRLTNLLLPMSLSETYRTRQYQQTCVQIWQVKIISKQYTNKTMSCALRLISTKNVLRQMTICSEKYITSINNVFSELLLLNICSLSVGVISS